MTYLAVYLVGDVKYTAVYLVGDVKYTVVYLVGDVKYTAVHLVDDVKDMAVYLVGDVKYTAVYLVGDVKMRELILFRRHCVKSIQIRSFFWSVYFCIQSEYRKIRTRNNSVFGHFSRCAYLLGR